MAETRLTTFSVPHFRSGFDSLFDDFFRMPLVDRTAMDLVPHLSPFTQTSLRCNVVEVRGCASGCRGRAR
jgi:hypothetical protein